MGERPHAPPSSGWAGSPSRSRTSPITRSPSPTACAPRAAATSSRPTSRIGSTIASAGSWPASSVCGSRPRSAGRAPWRRTRHAPMTWAGTRTAVRERPPVGFGRRTTDSSNGPPDAAPPGRPWPTGAKRLDEELAASLLPERPLRGHKGSFGKLLVIAGSLDYAGAALLVCQAAGRGGAGLVTLAVPESLQPLFAAKVVEATTMGLPEDAVEEIDPEPALARILDHEHDAIVLGPGLRPGLATADLVRELIVPPGDEPPPIVLDAEALRSLATMDGWWSGERRPAVLTPHAGEFERLRAGSGVEHGADGDLIDDDDARVAAARDAAAAWHQVVVLKGARTVIASPDGEIAVAPFENPALATGGTGD